MKLVSHGYGRPRRCGTIARIVRSRITWLVTASIVALALFVGIINR